MDWRDLRQRYWRRDAWPLWVAVLIGVGLNAWRLVEFLGDIDFIITNRDRIATIGGYLRWVDDVAFHPAAGSALMVIGIIGLIAFGRRRMDIDADVGTSQRPKRHVMWCGIRWVWHGGLLGSEPLLVAHCPEHVEVRLKVRDNFTNHIGWPGAGDYISDYQHYQRFYCIRGPHLLLFDGDCETTLFGQVQARAVQLMAADLRKEGLLD